MRRKKRRATIIATGLHRRSRAKSPILKNHPKLILLTAVLICGLVLGAMTVRNPNDQLADALRTVIENEIQTGAGQPISWAAIYRPCPRTISPERVLTVTGARQPWARMTFASSSI